jgi:hypothetical protein
MKRTEFIEAKRTRRQELKSTLTALASALSFSPTDLPTDDEILQASRGGDIETIVDLKLKVALVRMLNALKVREDAS